MKYNYKIFEEKAKKRAKNEYFEYPRKPFIIRWLQRCFSKGAYLDFKRALLRLQKGIFCKPKGH